jgi:hypothetical protein
VEREGLGGLAGKALRGDGSGERAAQRRVGCDEQWVVLERVLAARQREQVDLGFERRGRGDQDRGHGSVVFDTKACKTLACSPMGKATKSRKAAKPAKTRGKAAGRSKAAKKKSARARKPAAKKTARPAKAKVARARKPKAPARKAARAAKPRAEKRADAAVERPTVTADGTSLVERGDEVESTPPALPVPIASFTF